MVAPCYLPSVNADPDGPTYDLAEIKRLVQLGGRSYRIEPIARTGAGKLKLDEEDIVECVLALDHRRIADGGHFHKTMESECRPGLFHDVYKTCHDGNPIYCKVQLMQAKETAAIVIQFKRDESR